MVATIDSDNCKNYLLAALPSEDYQRLAPHLEVVSLQLGQIIYDFNEPVEYVYFPHQALVSFVTTMITGATVEVGLVGSEGMTGVQSILGGAVPNQAVVQMAGQATRIRAERLKAEFDRGGALQKLLLRYVQVLLIQVSQTAACNSLHSLERRLARWLLLVQDVTGSDQLFLTQESISNMLGVRRAGVTESAKQLQDAGLIRYSRGKIAIVNLEGLEAASCECYRVVKDEMDEYKALMKRKRQLAPIDRPIHKPQKTLNDEVNQKHHMHPSTSSQTPSQREPELIEQERLVQEVIAQSRKARQLLQTSLQKTQALVQFRRGLLQTIEEEQQIMDKRYIHKR